MTFDTRPYIDVTTLDIRKLVAAAFECSRPQGLGFIQHQPGPVTDAEIDSGMQNPRRISYDYLRGRSMKFYIRIDGDKRWWGYGWYDHSDDLQMDVLRMAGMGEPDAIDAVMKAKAGLADANREYEEAQAREEAGK